MGRPTSTLSFSQRVNVAFERLLHGLVRLPVGLQIALIAFYLGFLANICVMLCWQYAPIAAPAHTITNVSFDIEHVARSNPGDAEGLTMHRAVIVILPSTLSSIAYEDSHVEYLALGCYLFLTTVLFHMTEFIIAALYRPGMNEGPMAFMIFHSPAYMIAVACSWIELFVRWVWNSQHGSWSSVMHAVWRWVGAAVQLDLEDSTIPAAVQQQVIAASIGHLSNLTSAAAKANGGWSAGSSYTLRIQYFELLRAWFIEPLSAVLRWGGMLPSGGVVMGDAVLEVPDWSFRISLGWIIIFFTLSAAAYFVRAKAMMDCGSNFSLQVEDDYRHDHQLVKTGLYKYMRHPAYCGWFWFVVLREVLIGNVVCLVAFTAVTWKFFQSRIRDEEASMSQDTYFGQEYRAYKASGVPSGVPGIP